ANRHGADLDKGLAAGADGASLRIESLAVAGRTAQHAHVLLELQPPWTCRRLLEARHQLRNNALPPSAVLPHLAPAMLPLPGDVAVARPMQDPLFVLFRQFLPGLLQIDAERIGDSLEYVLAPSPHSTHRPDDGDSPLEEAQRGVGDEQVGVEGIAGAQ